VIGLKDYVPLSSPPLLLAIIRAAYYLAFEFSDRMEGGLTYQRLLMADGYPEKILSRERIPFILTERNRDAKNS